MTVSFQTSHLRPALSNLKAVVKKNAVTPILECVLFSIGQSSSLRATDLETTLEISIQSVSTDTFSFAVPLDFISEAVNACKSGEVTITADDDSMSMSIVSGKQKYSTSYLDAVNFPSPEKAEGEVQTVDGSALSEAINQVRPLCAKDDPRPGITGVCIWQTNEGVVAVSTNIVSLTRSPFITGLSEVPNGHIVLSQSAAKALSDISVGEDVKISLSKSHLSAEVEGSKLFCRLVDGKFVQWPSFIPSYTTGFTLNKSEITSAVKAAIVAADKEAFRMSLSLSGGQLAISTDDVMAGRSANSSTGIVSQDCPDLTIAFNGKLFADCLETIPGDTVRVLTDGSFNKAAVLVTANNDRFTLLMPLA